MSLKMLARKILDREEATTNRGNHITDDGVDLLHSPEPPETSDSITERIGIRFDVPALGQPILHHLDGSPLAFEGDPPLIRVYAWALTRISHILPEPVDQRRIVGDCRLSASEVKSALIQLVLDGDLVRIVERRRELFRLNIKY